MKQRIRRNDTVYCVIAGDIVNSRQLDDDVREEVALAANSVFAQINAEYGAGILADFHIVRGDAFEGILLAQHLVPCIVMKIIKAFYAVSKTAVRISVVIGELITRGININEYDGPAFHKANDKLEKMKRTKDTHWFQLYIDSNSQAQPLIDSLLGLMASTSRRWTERQREIVWALDQYEQDQKLVGKNLAISASVVKKQARAANFDEYNEAWKSLEDYLIVLEAEMVCPSSKQKPNYTSFYSYGLHKFNQGSYSEASELLLKAIELAKADLGDHDSELTVLYDVLAASYIKAGKPDKAKSALNESLDLQKERPKMRTEMARTQMTCGDYYLTFEDMEQAQRAYFNALDIFENLFGIKHPCTGNCYSKIASLYIENAEYAAAIEYLDKALNIEEGLGNGDPVKKGDLYFKIGKCYSEIGDERRAMDSFAMAGQLYNDHLGAKDKKIQTVYACLNETRLREAQNA